MRTINDYNPFKEHFKTELNNFDKDVFNNLNFGLKYILYYGGNKNGNK